MAVESIEYELSIIGYPDRQEHIATVNRQNNIITTTINYIEYSAIISKETIYINDQFPSWLNADHVVAFFEECLFDNQNMSVYFSNKDTNTYKLCWVLNESGFYIELPLDNNKEKNLKEQIDK